MLCVPTKLERYRRRARVRTFDLRHPDYWASDPGENYGAFETVPGPCGERLLMVVSDGKLDGWEHVSVSIDRKGRARLPNWEEMCFVKNMFWEAEDCVVQYHPPLSRSVNNYRVLHLWRSLRHDFPQPPMEMVGIQSLGELS
jgi:hypothetical protein